MPNTTKKPSRVPAKAKPSTALVPVAAVDSLTRVPSAAAGEVVRDGDVIAVIGVPYLAHGVPVPAAEIFFDGGVRPKANGPWLGEADKVAWRDPATGYECIIMRENPGGFLGGYVGVPAQHPLFGFRHDAVPADLGIEVHNGLTYARLCEDGPTPQRRVRYEAQRICHVAVPIAIAHAGDYRVDDAHQWWFGFTCDRVADVIPNRPEHARRAAALGVVPTYRDDAYVYNEVTNLAAQLRAIADGVAVPPRVGPPLPPASLDPRHGS